MIGASCGETGGRFVVYYNIVAALYKETLKYYAIWIH